MRIGTLLGTLIAGVAVAAVQADELPTIPQPTSRPPMSQSGLGPIGSSLPSEAPEPLDCWFVTTVLQVGSWLGLPTLINVYESDPNLRMEQLLFESDDLRQIRNNWRQFWFTDQPSHMTYERIHGGVGP